MNSSSATITRPLAPGVSLSSFVSNLVIFSQTTLVEKPPNAACQPFCVSTPLPPGYQPSQLKNHRKKISTSAAVATHGMTLGLRRTLYRRWYSPGTGGAAARSGAGAVVIRSDGGSLCDGGGADGTGGAPAGSWDSG